MVLTLLLNYQQFTQFQVLKILLCGSTKILDSLNIIKYLSFGAETNDIKKLLKISETLSSEPKEFKELLKKELEKHITYPKAIHNSIKNYLGEEYSSLLTPNNTLGIEYLKSLIKQKSTITPVIIKRISSSYNDEKINKISSATAIRKQLIKNNLKQTKKTLPESTFKILQSADIVSSIKLFENEILYQLRTMSEKEISNLPDTTLELSKRIKKASDISESLEKLIENIKTKTYTEARIKRILLYCLLKITKKDMEDSKKITPYIRVLAFNQNGKKIISEIKKQNPNLNIITHLKKFEQQCKNKKILRMLQIDKYATDIYTLKQPNNPLSNQDYTIKL